MFGLRWFGSSKKPSRNRARTRPRSLRCEGLEARQLLAGDTAALFAPAGGTFFLRHENAPGPADDSFQFGPAGAGWTPLAGDWNGDGMSSVGLYDPATSTFYLKNANSPGIADIVYQFGPGGAGWEPIVGDWDGNGTQTVGLYSGTTFFLQNSHQGGLASTVFSYGPSGAGWQPIAGDWNGNGSETVGLYSGETFFLKNTNAGGVADVVFGFGPAASWTAIAGDWNNDQVTTVGLYSGQTFFLRNANAAGIADVSLSYGPSGAGWLPLAGDWTSLSTAPIMFAASVNQTQQITIPSTGCIVNDTFLADLTLNLTGNGMSGNPFAGTLVVDGENQAVHAPGSSGTCDLSVANQDVTATRPLSSNGNMISASETDTFYTATFSGVVSNDMSQVTGTVTLVAPLFSINMSIPVTFQRL